MADGAVCDQVTKLAERVYEIGLVCERLKADTGQQAEMLKAHQVWLSSHQELMERMAVSESDRRVLHDDLARSRTELKAQLDSVTTTAKWAITLTVPVLATGVFEIIRYAITH